ncbi:hypothetical protein [Novosphingobium sp.]|jgi:hypothetical protein|uniref:hypothetical protein n=1 Tax=Novosphingobium sp. TaxID=1874826 RepID=UPI002FE06EFC
MGWKSVKEHYRILHNVAVYPEKGICIGSPYIHDIIVISLDGVLTKTDGEDRWGKSINADIDRYQNEMREDPELLARLVAQPDTFERSIPVYTYEGAEIVECACEEVGYPNVTHDGRMMFENTFSADRDQVVKWAARNARASVEGWSDRVDECTRQLAKVKERRDEASRQLAAFEAMEAEVLAREAGP